LTVDKMTPEQKEAMGAIRCAGGSHCEYDPKSYDAYLLRNPGLENAFQNFADPVLPRRGNSPVPAYLGQTALIVTARFYNCRAEWAAQVSGARKAGTTEATITAAAEGKKQPGMKLDEAAVFDFTYELLHKHAVSDATFKKVVDIVGERGVLDLIGGITVWTFLTLSINTAEDNFFTAQNKVDLTSLLNSAPFPQATATGRPFR
jgi:4-carboxymuconolactone decarboxylase